VFPYFIRTELRGDEESRKKYEATRIFRGTAARVNFAGEIPSQYNALVSAEIDSATAVTERKRKYADYRSLHSA